MAMCEKCNKSGLSPNEMFIEFDSFIGPCCATPYSRPVVPRPTPVVNIASYGPRQSDDVEYGIEVSNKVGIKAYANYQGLKVSFERTPAQLRKWAEAQGLMSA